jgi:tetratricopeptide (TPR) repeat protein
MLSEEVLIVLAALGACGLVLLGVAELLWPTRRRHPPRRSIVVAAADAGDRPVVSSTGESATADGVVRAPRPHRTSALSRHGLEPGRSPYVRRGPAAPALATGEAAAESATLTDTVAVPTPADGSVIERCFSLHEAGRHADAVALGLAALHGPDDAGQPVDAHAMAALWSVIARCRQALGQHAEARAALESAIDAAPVADRPVYQRQLAGLAESVARALLEEAGGYPRPGSEERLVAIARAATWADCAAAALPGDTALAELAATAQAALWPAYERTVTALVQRQDFRGARRLLREALADPRFPTARVETFHELFSTTFSGEIGQLTALAIRSVQEGREAEAASALHRVETLLTTLSDAALSPTRREEVQRRLAWAYLELGKRRAAAEPETALDLALRALDHEADADRRREACGLLARTLQALVDSRAPDVRALIETGDREAAAAHCETLSTLARRVVDKGVPLADFAPTLTRIQRLFDALKDAPGS